MAKVMHHYRGTARETTKEPSAFGHAGLGATHDLHQHLAAHFQHVHSSIHVPGAHEPTEHGVLHSEMHGLHQYLSVIAFLNNRKGPARSYHDVEGELGRIAASQPEFAVAFSRLFHLDHQPHND